MKKLLRIDASARTAGSHSRELADFCIENWMAANPSAKVLVRDLSDGHVPHLSQATIEGFKALLGAPPTHLEPGVQLSDTLIGELLAVDSLLISSSLYNFGSPSSLSEGLVSIGIVSALTQVIGQADNCHLISCSHSFPLQNKR